MSQEFIFVLWETKRNNWKLSETSLQVNGLGFTLRIWECIIHNFLLCNTNPNWNFQVMKFKLKVIENLEIWKNVSISVLWKNLHLYYKLTAKLFLKIFTFDFTLQLTLSTVSSIMLNFLANIRSYWHCTS